MKESRLSSDVELYLALPSYEYHVKRMFLMDAQGHVEAAGCTSAVRSPEKCEGQYPQ